jgi:hypothetical protein
MSSPETPGLDMSQITQAEWDAARRMAEAHNLHVAAALATREHRTTAPFIAIDLEDGRSDGVLYDSRADAVRHQKSDNRFYVKVAPVPMPDREALVCLMYARRAYKTGHVFAEEEVVMPQRLELAQPFIPRTLRGVGGIYRRG